jgi:5'-nucleotidase
LRILLTNDDGINARGLLTALEALTKAGHEVTACAPDRERSASSHSVTLRKPILVTPTKMPDGSTGYATSGTPGDSARVGIELFREKPFDLVVSGVNNDLNVGFDVNYSGTVAGALEGAANKIPAIAFSVQKLEPYDWNGVGKIAADVVGKFPSYGIPVGVILNVNIPHRLLSEEYVWVVSQTEAAPETLDVAKNPDGTMVVTRQREAVPELLEDNTDVDHLRRGFVTLTPLGPVGTNREVLLRFAKTGRET